ncbi:nitric oxide synthase oxygenase [Paenibacillus agricola]|uniref:Nitric oxide synthase oxygenase n=1 Tax=Paenibacillus agricola TaxID=2716264 RepID=A0ABX0J8A1_9BACL|nr:nitric oxide synthase oxygenase [Paenibacillus agricola]NHN29985.1 nitric oxide synthase oxygenase [Paenibacillus agricola]
MEPSHTLEEAGRFMHIFYSETGKTQEAMDKRIAEIRQAIAVQGFYEHTFEELQYGAKLAWRNSNKCIGRLFWETLHIFDARSLETEEEIAHALYNHIEYATNGGRIRPTITIFKRALQPEQQVRIVNYQLIRYAGYETEAGVVGDPESVAITKLCQGLGWEGAGSPYDVLPLVVQIGDRLPRIFDIPPALVLEVPLRHPDIAGFADLELQWYAVPIVSNMRLEIGGINYTAAPFNGWYMGTEIGARNLADTGRYNLLPKVALMMGLDTSRDSTLWKDRALVELNVAVLDSFKQHSVAIVDHHTAAQQFMRFEANEQKKERPVTGNWSWLISPLSPATTHVFHQDYVDTILKPNFFYQDKLGIERLQEGKVITV